MEFGIVETSKRWIVPATAHVEQVKDLCVVIDRGTGGSMCCTRLFILWGTPAQLCLVVDKPSLVSLDLAGLSAGGTRPTNEFAGTE